MKDLRDIIEKEIMRVAKQLPAEPAGLYEPFRYTLGLGGKRLRPVLVLMASELFGGQVRKALPAAVAMELFHNFSLVHDDIMDRAPLRRNRATVHKKWNENIAILSGDVMLVHAYRELEKTEPVHLPHLLRLFSKMAARVCEGQQLDMDYEKKSSVSIPEYLHMIELKTAVLVGACLQAGALLGGAGEKAAGRLCEFGKNIGIAFQLMDDVLDVFGDEKDFGKKKGGDIIANKKTFLSLKALELCDKKERASLAGLLFTAQRSPQRKVELVLKAYARLGVRVYAEKEMESYYRKALTHLHSLPLPAARKRPLEELAASLLQRKK